MNRTGSALLGLLALGLAGCPSASIYGTARTTPVGQWSNTISAEGFGLVAETVEPDGSTHLGFGMVPTLPTYQLRRGLSEDLDVGFRVASGANVGMDAKYCFLRDD